MTNFAQTTLSEAIQDDGPPIKISRSSKQRRGTGGFRIEILHPGLALGRGDSGLGTIGRIDHAQVQPGTLVAMHPHRDDEILTYLRSGRVEHRDSWATWKRSRPPASCS